MRSRLILSFVVSMSAGALAQQTARFEVAIGAGRDIIYTSTLFKNEHNRSASIFFSPVGEWGVFLSFGQQVYTLDRLPSEHESFLSGRTPQIYRTVSSFLIGYRDFLPSQSRVFKQYGTVALGVAKSVPSAEGYYFTAISPDTSYNQLKSGHFLLGVLSLGIQVRPLTFIDLFAELQTSIPLNMDLFPGLIAYRVGVGVMF
jgi:hypothetical protein